jgi:hypothetical protein
VVFIHFTDSCFLLCLSELIISQVTASYPQSVLTSLYTCLLARTEMSLSSRDTTSAQPSGGEGIVTYLHNRDKRSWCFLYLLIVLELFPSLSLRIWHMWNSGHQFLIHWLPRWLPSIEHYLPDTQIHWFLYLLGYFLSCSYHCFWVLQNLWRWSM